MKTFQYYYVAILFIPLFFSFLSSFFMVLCIKLRVWHIIASALPQSCKTKLQHVFLRCAWIRYGDHDMRECNQYLVLTSPQLSNLCISIKRLCAEYGEDRVGHHQGLTMNNDQRQHWRANHPQRAESKQWFCDPDVANILQW